MLPDFEDDGGLTVNPRPCSIWPGTAGATGPKGHPRAPSQSLRSRLKVEAMLVSIKPEKMSAKMRTQCTEMAIEKGMRRDGETER